MFLKCIKDFFDEVKAEVKAEMAEVKAEMAEVKFETEEDMFPVYLFAYDIIDKKIIQTDMRYFKQSSSYYPLSFSLVYAVYDENKKFEREVPLDLFNSVSEFDGYLIACIDTNDKEKALQLIKEYIKKELFKTNRKECFEKAMNALS